MTHIGGNIYLGSQNVGRDAKITFLTFQLVLKYVLEPCKQFSNLAHFKQTRWLHEKKTGKDGANYL